ncbi:hypothetical protein O181_108984 [Austropuccinia psidii MF-1]|uniref:Uncharacterized protein n=1 Tax=Austropuccinia psidii MF-1 TaxID=1389203 RepID=A0A9Q3PPG3_9BASI|nr:hypothetical protein [Austropuccinia psidii MF-1]
MQKTVTFNNTQEVVSMNMSSTTSTLHTNSTPLKQSTPNQMTSPTPYHLPLSNPLFPQQSHLRLPPPPQLLLRNKFPNIHQMSPPEDLHNVNLLISTMTTLWKYKPITSPILQLRSIHLLQQMKLFKKNYMFQ